MTWGPTTPSRYRAAPLPLNVGGVTPAGPRQWPSRSNNAVVAMRVISRRGAASGIGDQRPLELALGLTVTAAQAVPGGDAGSGRGPVVPRSPNALDSAVSGPGRPAHRDRRIRAGCCGAGPGDHPHRAAVGQGAPGAADSEWTAAAGVACLRRPADGRPFGVVAADGGR